MSVEDVLQRLEMVRRTARNRWLARCPAHQDARPSLSIYAHDDGRTLLHCWAGCRNADVVAALGLPWSALFPPRGHDFKGGSPRQQIRATSASEALRVLAYEASLVALLAGDLAAGKGISEGDRRRLLLAVDRIAKAEGACS